MQIFLNIYNFRIKIYRLRRVYVTQGCQILQFNCIEVSFRFFVGSRVFQDFFSFSLILEPV